MHGSHAPLIVTLAALLGFWTAGCQKEQVAEAEHFALLPAEGLIAQRRRAATHHHASVR